MLDLHEGILSEFAEAQRGYQRLDWKEEDGWRAIRANDHAKKRWAAANKEKQREYNRKYRAANREAYNERARVLREKRRAAMACSTETVST